ESWAYCFGDSNNPDSSGPIRRMRQVSLQLCKVNRRNILMNPQWSRGRSALSGEICRTLWWLTRRSADKTQPQRYEWIVP
ncbi:MAG: hypothetical protein KDB01_19545, partial [Planctomycetaceae bacterium]|nr:hypothetical protein [Planctomycetaceae bacterium]